MALGKGSSRKFGVPFNIFTMAESSDFKFGTQLGCAKAHYKITPREGELPKIWWFPFNIFTMAEYSDFKSCTQLGFAKVHHKITSGGISGVALGWGAPQNFGVTL